MKFRDIRRHVGVLNIKMKGSMTFGKLIDCVQGTKKAKILRLL